MHPVNCEVEELVLQASHHYQAQAGQRHFCVHVTPPHNLAHPLQPQKYLHWRYVLDSWGMRAICVPQQNFAGNMAVGSVIISVSLSMIEKQGFPLEGYDVLTMLCSFAMED